MRKLLATLLLAATVTPAFATVSFLAGLNDRYVATGGLLTTTTVSVYTSPLIGLAVFLDNGEAYVDLKSDKAVGTLMVAVEHSVYGEEMSDLDVSIIQVYADSMGVSSDEMVEIAAQNL